MLLQAFSDAFRRAAGCEHVIEERYVEHISFRFPCSHVRQTEINLVLPIFLHDIHSYQITLCVRQFAFLTHGNHVHHVGAFHQHGGGEKEAAGLRGCDVGAVAELAQIFGERCECFLVLHQGDDVNEVHALDGEVFVKFQFRGVVHLSAVVETQR